MALLFAANHCIPQLNIKLYNLGGFIVLKKVFQNLSICKRLWYYFLRQPLHSSTQYQVVNLSIYCLEKKFFNIYPYLKGHWHYFFTHCSRVLLKLRCRWIWREGEGCWKKIVFPNLIDRRKVRGRKEFWSHIFLSD